MEKVIFTIKLNVSAIKERLNRENITYEQFGRMILTKNGKVIPKQTIYRWLSGKTTPSYKIIVRMSIVLNCRIEQIAFSSSGLKVDYLASNQLNNEGVRRKLNEKSLTYEKFGEQLMTKKGTKISKQSISDWINGRRSIDYCYIVQIANFFKCEVKEIAVVNLK